jgi:hypothetical protein
MNAGAIYTNENLVRDGNLITARDCLSPVYRVRARVSKRHRRIAVA